MSINSCILTALTSLQLLGAHQIHIVENYQPKATLLIHRPTNTVVFKENEQEAIEIASITKLMTVYITLKETKDLEQFFEIDETIFKITQIPELSNNYMYIGEKYTIKQLIELSLISSSNAAAVALAKFNAGNDIDFVKKMNEYAKNIGMKNTTFYNSSGVGDYVLPLDDELGIIWKDSVSSAQDIGILTKTLIEQFPEVLEISNHKQKIINDELVTSTIQNVSNKINGLKTGTGTHNNVVLTSDEYISVVLAAGKDDENKTVRFKIAESLMDVSNQYIKKMQLYQTGEHRVNDIEFYTDKVIEVYHLGNEYTIDIVGDSVIYNEKYQNHQLNTQSFDVKIVRRYKQVKGMNSSLVMISSLVFVWILKRRKKRYRGYKKM